MEMPQIWNSRDRDCKMLRAFGSQTFCEQKEAEKYKLPLMEKRT